MTSSPFSAPEPQNTDDAYGAGVPSNVSAGEAVADPYQQADAAAGAYPPGAEQAQQADYQQQGYQGAAYQQPGYQQQGYQDPAYQQAGYQNPAGAYGQPYAVYNQKSKVAAGLLGIFLGSLGIHNFYLGYTGKAVAQLLITLLSFGLLAVVTWIWGLVEGIIILTATPGAQPWGVDAKGVPLSN